MATQVEIAEHLDLTSRRVRDLKNAGILPKPVKKGQWDLDACRVAYIRHLRKVASGHQPEGGDLDLTGERAKLTREHRIAQEMKNAETVGELVRIEDVLDLVGRDYSNLRTRLLSIPPKLAPEVILIDTTNDAKEVIEGAVKDALAELSSDTDGSLAGIGGAVAGGPVGVAAGSIETAADSKPKRVGGRRKAAQSRGQRGTRKVEDKPG